MARIGIGNVLFVFGDQRATPGLSEGRPHFKRFIRLFITRTMH